MATYENILLTCAPNEDSNQPAHPHSLIRVHCPCEETLYPWLSKYAKSLRKHAYTNILKILTPKNENFQIKNSDIFHISAQNIDCWYSLEPPSNEYTQSLF